MAHEPNLPILSFPCPAGVGVHGDADVRRGPRLFLHAVEVMKRANSFSQRERPADGLGHVSLGEHDGVLQVPSLGKIGCQRAGEGAAGAMGLGRAQTV